MKKLFVISFVLFFSHAIAQKTGQKLAKAFAAFQNDSQLKYAISSLYVVDAKSGAVLFDRNSRVGLAPASTQKIITASTAFELLGKDFRYHTSLWNVDGKFLLAGSGDPTFGSWRFPSASNEAVMDEIINALKQAGIKDIDQIYTTGNADNELMPSGWIYEDAGNYYGAKAAVFNWNENQYDLVFIPGKKQGDETSYDTTASWWNWKSMINECKTGAPGSGDNAYIYFIPGSRSLIVKGTIPEGVNRFTISGADYFPACSFTAAFYKRAREKGFYHGTENDCGTIPAESVVSLSPDHIVFTHASPRLDSIIYWFLQKSINLYGEALVKTLGSENNLPGTTEKGVDVVKHFWAKNGIDEDELNISDGSGLSPQNRVTTHAQVEILKYAKTRDWFPYFYDGFPTYNGMKMKSGTIRDVKGFCGYQQSKDGHEYIFSFLVNNYNGRSSSLVAEMFKVLNELK